MSDAPPATRFRIAFDQEDLGLLTLYAREYNLPSRMHAAGEIVCKALHPEGRHKKHLRPGGEDGTVLHLHLNATELEALDAYRDQEMPGRATRGQAISRILGQALDRMEQLRRFDEARPR